MVNIDVLLILQRGVIGLGFLLSLLAFWLLSHEQNCTKPRPAILASIKSFMVISVIFCVFGLVSELVPIIYRDYISADKGVAELRGEVSRLQRVEANYKRTCEHIRTTNWLDKSPAVRFSLEQYCLLG